jgi:hypothetical protein
MSIRHANEDCTGVWDIDFESSVVSCASCKTTYNLTDYAGVHALHENFLGVLAQGMTIQGMIMLLDEREEDMEC